MEKLEHPLWIVQAVNAAFGPLVRAMLRARFAGDPDVRYANLGQLVDLRDRSLAYDGMHLTARGNEIVADRLLAPATALVGHQ